MYVIYWYVQWHLDKFEISLQIPMTPSQEILLQMQRVCIQQNANNEKTNDFTRTNR